MYFLCDLFHYIGFLFCILWKSMMVPLLILETWICTDPCKGLCWGFCFLFFCKAESISPNELTHKSVAGELNLQRALWNTFDSCLFTYRFIPTVERMEIASMLIFFTCYKTDVYVLMSILKPTIPSHQCFRPFFLPHIWFSSVQYSGRSQ